MIEVKNLKKSFKEINAVNDLSFKINKGEVVGFLGPNGAGKTTTMRLITGFIFPDSGNVIIDGISVTKEPTKAQKLIGYLPENNPLYKDMLVSELLNLSANLKNIPKDERKSSIDFVVKAMAIGEVFYRPLGELSKGYKQRVGMAIALLHKPQVLIMDEPTEGLDPNQRAEIRALIKDLSKEHTIIMSTHVMQEAMAVCGRMIIINNGTLIADGTPNELSRVSKNEKIIFVDVEGDGIDFALRNMEGVEHIDIEREGDRRVKAKIIVSDSVELRPKLSRLIQDKRWTVWKLMEKESNLEDIFHKLTSEI